MAKRLTYEFVEKEIAKVGHKLLSKEYKNNYTKLKVKCDKGHTYYPTWANFNRKNKGSRCPECSGNKKKTIEEIKKYAEKFDWECLSNIYIGKEYHLLFKCPNNHKCKISWNAFRNGCRCSKCWNKIRGKSRKFTLEEIKKRTIELAPKYKCISNKYINALNKLKFKCNKGHDFKMTWACFQQGQRCPKCYKENNKKENHPMWKGGVTEKNITLYDTYTHQISWCEEVRRDPDNSDLLQVRCTESSCRKWFNPNRNEINSRIAAINSADKGLGSCNFYCSKECKQKCSLYWQRKYPKDFKSNYSRPEQAELRQMALERENYTCERCGLYDETGKELIAHHYEGLNVNPTMSADLEMIVVLCKECDDKAHSELGCRPIDLIRRNLCHQESG